MNRLLFVLLTTSVLTAFPPEPKPAQARSLFETLFPQAAERRKKRKARELKARQNRLKAVRRRQQNAKKDRIKKLIAVSKPARVKAAKYHTYAATRLRPVKFSSLAKSFSKQLLIEQMRKTQAWDATVQTHFEEKRLNLDSFASTYTGPTAIDVSLASHASSLSAVSLKARPKLAKAVLKHYKTNPQFLWVTEKGERNENARALELVLAGASEYGLQSADYEVPELPSADDLEANQSAARLAYEFSMTSRTLRYLSDAKHGLVNPDKISDYHDFPANKIVHGKLLAAFVKASSPAEFLVEAHPSDSEFAALKAELVTIDSETYDEPEPIEITLKTYLKPGDVNEEISDIVLAIRRRAGEKILAKHAEVLAADHSGGEYTPELVALVKDMQKAMWLKPDGYIGKKTVRGLLAKQKADPQTRRKQVLYAMERLRWHPDTLGPNHVFINQPAYRVSLKRGGKQVLAMNVVVGKKANQTNFFHDEISHVEFNPYWGVPRSILVNEMLPKLRRNAGYLDRLGYEVKTPSGKRVASSSINWYGVGSKFPYDVRQPPGPKNALGRLKIMFPNKHSIYMHDTPAKALFSRRTRAYSHGCVRLQHPEVMAAAVLRTTVSDVESEIGLGKNKARNLKTKLPVYVAYFTAWPNEAGEVKYFADIYGRDKALAKALDAEAKVRSAL